jgi:hypothetical protein
VRARVTSEYRPLWTDGQLYLNAKRKRPDRTYVGDGVKHGHPYAPRSMEDRRGVSRVTTALNCVIEISARERRIVESDGDAQAIQRIPIRRRNSRSPRGPRLGTASLSRSATAPRGRIRNEPCYRDGHDDGNPDADDHAPASEDPAPRDTRGYRGTARRLEYRYLHGGRRLPARALMAVDCSPWHGGSMASMRTDHARPAKVPAESDSSSRTEQVGAQRVGARSPPCPRLDHGLAQT